MKTETKDIQKAEMYQTTPPQAMPQVILKPAAKPHEVKEALKAFFEIRNSCLDQSDLLYIGHDGKPVENKIGAVSTHIKKSGWRKIALAFNLSWSVSLPVYEEHEDEFGKFFTYTSTAIVTAPNGRQAQATGSCSSRNPFFSTRKGNKIAPAPEDIAMMSQTVALNRAISDIVGSGEVTADEIISKTKPVVHTDFYPDDAQPEPEAYAQSEPKKQENAEPRKQESNEVDRSIEIVPDEEKDALQKIFVRAYFKGMSRKAYENMVGKFTNMMTREDYNKIKYWLVKHYPELFEEK